MFLGQTSKTDNHADLCACRNYYETLVANGVTNSKLELMKPDEESCFCIHTNKSHRRVQPTAERGRGKRRAGTSRSVVAAAQGSALSALWTGL
jgi:hypothetical protein